MFTCLTYNNVSYTYFRSLDIYTLYFVIFLRQLWVTSNTVFSFPPTWEKYCYNKLDLNSRGNVHLRARVCVLLTFSHHIVDIFHDGFFRKNYFRQSVKSSDFSITPGCFKFAGLNRSSLGRSPQRPEGHGLLPFRTQ